MNSYSYDYAVPLSSENCKIFLEILYYDGRLTVYLKKGFLLFSSMYRL